MTDKGVSELFAALTVNKEFAAKFINPETRLEAIQTGYLGKKFDLSHDEMARLILAQGEKVPEIARSYIGAERL